MIEQQLNRVVKDFLYHNFQFIVSLWTASAVLYFYNAKIYSFFSDGLVDISL